MKCIYIELIDAFIIHPLTLIIININAFEFFFIFFLKCKISLKFQNKFLANFKLNSGEYEMRLDELNKTKYKKIIKNLILKLKKSNQILILLNKKK